MEMVATRELANNSGKVMRAADKNGFLVITKGGKPRSILISTSEKSLLNDVRSVINMRARQIIRDAQIRSAKNGLARISQKEIDAEIAAVRKARV